MAVRSVFILAALAAIAACVSTAALTSVLTDPTLAEYVRLRNRNIQLPSPAVDSCEYTIRSLIEEPARARAVSQSPEGRSWCAPRPSGDASIKKLTAAPQQIHITVTPTPGNVSVMWLTNTTPNASRVCYSRGPVFNRRTAQCVAGTTWTYFPVTVIPWTGNVHAAYMVGLKPQRKYCYIVGDSVLKNYSAPVCFLSPNTVNKENILVALGGDMGTYQLCGHLVATQMRQDEIAKNLTIDAFWLLGDLSYSTLSPPQDNLEELWDLFLQQEESLINHVPFLATYGNHDIAGGDSAGYLNRFLNPGTDRSGSKYYWSYTHGPVFFISMCTEVMIQPVNCTYAPGSPQYLWIEQQLASVNRTETPWVIVGGHRPMYSADTATDSGPLQQYIEPLLIKYGVDVNMAGHMHETELTYPVNNNTVYSQGFTRLSNNSFQVENAAAPVHMTVGCLGALIDEKFEKPLPAWELFHAGTIKDPGYGYATMQANRTTLVFKVHNQANNRTIWSLILGKS